MRRLQLLFAVLLMLSSVSSIVASQTSAQDASPQASSNGAALPLTGDLKAEFETYVQTTLTKLGVPGASIAVVQGGDVVYLQGFGMREVGGIDKVTPDTLMMIGSDTKSITSMLAATMVDDGTISWDTPLVDLLPNFAVADPQVTQALTVADAFCACTGLPARDAELTLNFDSMTPDKLIASVADFPLTAPVGKKFQYSNQMYAIGGYALAAAGGAAPDDLSGGYEKLLRDRVLDPIGMSQSTFALADIQANDDFAVPHSFDINVQMQPISLNADYAFGSAVAPAGGLWSNASDMARYVQTQLAGGVTPDGKQVVSAENLARTQAPHVSISPIAQGMPPLLTDYAKAYGMGWYVGEYKGRTMLSHTGSTLGYFSDVALLPDDDLGIVILTNGGPAAQSFTLAVKYRLFELLFDEPAEVDQLANQIAHSISSAFAQMASQLGQVDPAVVAPYLGRYTNPALGDVELKLEGLKLMLDMGELSSELKPIGDGSSPVAVYIFTDPPLAGPGVSILLRLDDTGNPEIAATIQVESDQPYIFTRAAPARATPGP